jgi:hypothetical protein
MQQAFCSASKSIVAIQLNNRRRRNKMSDKKPAIAARTEREKTGSKRLYRLALALPVLLFAGVTNAQYQQYPIMEGIATRVIQKYQQSSCEQLWQQRGQPKSQREQEAVNMLRDDPQMRAAFINRVAAPIANKMFECGLLP